MEQYDQNYPKEAQSRKRRSSDSTANNNSDIQSNRPDFRHQQQPTEIIYISNIKEDVAQAELLEIISALVKVLKMHFSMLDAHTCRGFSIMTVTWSAGESSAIRRQHGSVIGYLSSLDIRLHGQKLRFEQYMERRIDKVKRESILAKKKICVLGIPKKLGVDNLRSIFERFGDIEHIYIREKKAKKVDLGFVIYKRKEDAAMVVGMHKVKSNDFGCTLVVKALIPKTDHETMKREIAYEEQRERWSSNFSEEYHGRSSSRGGLGEASRPAATVGGVGGTNTGRGGRVDNNKLVSDLGFDGGHQSADRGDRYPGSHRQSGDWSNGYGEGHSGSRNENLLRNDKKAESYNHSHHEGRYQESWYGLDSGDGYGSDYKKERQNHVYSARGDAYQQQISGRARGPQDRSQGYAASPDDYNKTNLNNLNKNNYYLKGSQQGYEAYLGREYSGSGREGRTATKTSFKQSVEQHAIREYSTGYSGTYYQRQGLEELRHQEFYANNSNHNSTSYSNNKNGFSVGREQHNQNALFKKKKESSRVGDGSPLNLLSEIQPKGATGTASTQFPRRLGSHQETSFKSGSGGDGHNHPYSAHHNGSNHGYYPSNGYRDNNQRAQHQRSPPGYNNHHHRPSSGHFDYDGFEGLRGARASNYQPDFDQGLQNTEFEPHFPEQHHQDQQQRGRRGVSSLRSPGNNLNNGNNNYNGNYLQDQQNGFEDYRDNFENSRTREEEGDGPRRLQEAVRSSLHREIQHNHFKGNLQLRKSSAETFYDFDYQSKYSRF